MNIAIISAIFSAIAEAVPLIVLIYKNKMEKEKQLQSDRAELLTAWKESYASKDISKVVDALRRVRNSQ